MHRKPPTVLLMLLLCACSRAPSADPEPETRAATDSPSRDQRETISVWVRANECGGHFAVATDEDIDPNDEEDIAGWERFAIAQGASLRVDAPLGASIVLVTGQRPSIEIRSRIEVRPDLQWVELRAPQCDQLHRNPLSSVQTRAEVEPHARELLWTDAPLTESFEGTGVFRVHLPAQTTFTVALTHQSGPAPRMRLRRWAPPAEAPREDRLTCAETGCEMSVSFRSGPAGPWLFEAATEPSAGAELRIAAP